MRTESVETPEGQLQFDESTETWTLRDRSGRSSRLTAGKALALLSAFVAPAAMAGTASSGGYGGPVPT